MYYLKTYFAKKKKKKNNNNILYELKISQHVDRAIKH